MGGNRSHLSLSWGRPPGSPHRPQRFLVTWGLLPYRVATLALLRYGIGSASAASISTKDLFFFKCKPGLKQHFPSCQGAWSLLVAHGWLCSTTACDKHRGVICIFTLVVWYRLLARSDACFPGHGHRYRKE